MDANVAVHFALAGNPLHAEARAFLARCIREDTRIVAPALFEAEADSSLRRVARLVGLSDEALDAAVRLLDALPVDILHDAAVRRQARRIADQTGQVRVYDSTYAALAEIRGCEFWTGDQRFFNAARGSLPFVRFIGNCPVGLPR